MVNTRFNPSTSGGLHLGHAMTLLVNEYLAHTYGGNFYVRFDDTSPNILVLPPDRVKSIMKEQREIIEWLEIKVDGWSKQSELDGEVRSRLLRLGHECEYDSLKPKLPTFVRFIGTGWVAYPYVPQQIAERVIMDAMLDITHVIRGEEFSTEFSMYLYYCEKFGITFPDFIYLPRLSCGGMDISKTRGGNTLVELRANGYTAQDVKDMLAMACLVCPFEGWDIYNLKHEPCLDL